MRARALLAPILATSVGCAGILDLHGVTVEHYVGGRLHGLWDGTDGVSLRLQAEGVDTLLTVSSNGSFQFPDLLASGTSYTVSIMVNPLQHTCDFESGRNGKVANIDVTNIVVACLGPAVTVKSSPWDWKFDPTQEVQTFAGSIVTQNIGITLTGESLIKASVNGTAATLGEPTSLSALPLGPTIVHIAFTATGGLSKTYEVVFDRGGSIIEQLAYAKASNTHEFDSFGYSIALSGDTLVVGAYHESSAATGVNGDQNDKGAHDAGAVYVFLRNGTTWTQQAYLKASNTGGGDSFGSSVALYGNTLAVGAFGESSASIGVNGNQADNSASAAGAVYVFVRSGTTWTQQAYIKASNVGAYDFFGSSVALYGDTLAIGAIGESSAAAGVDGNQDDNSTSNAGAVYVFVRNGTTWIQQAYLKASNTGAGDYFGYSVALYGDTLAVGAWNESSAATGINGNQADNSISGAGAVYVFVRNYTAWTQQAYVKASNTGAHNVFGRSIALYRDTLAVGAFNESSAATGINGNQTDKNASGAGAVYVFVRNDTTWSQQAYVKASNTEAGDSFGTSVALYADTLAVGAAGESSAAIGIDGDQTNDNAYAAGAAYLFVRNNTTWAQHAYVKASNTTTGDTLGDSIALDGDILAISANGESSRATGVNGNSTDDSALFAGAVYIYR